MLSQVPNSELGLAANKTNQILLLRATMFKLEKQTIKQTTNQPEGFQQVKVSMYRIRGWGDGV